MTLPPPAARQVAVRRLTFQQELTHVIRGAGLVVVAVWLYLASTLSGANTGTRTLLPFQSLVQDRPSVEQRVFRELQEGLLEAEAVRSTSGAWPSVDDLASQGIPPFASDPTVKNIHYQWTLSRNGAYVNYRGTPDRPDVPAWMILIQEPDPGTPPDQANEDEEHHRLNDGIMLHVSTWSHADGARLQARVVRVPQAEGWTQVYAVGPGTPIPVVIMPQ